jgi:hypothetical protein
VSEAKTERGALIHAIRHLVSLMKIDPRDYFFVIATKKHPAIFNAAIEAGATDTGCGFAVLIGTREQGESFIHMPIFPRDLIPCMVDQVVFGLPVEDLAGSGVIREVTS